MTQTVDIQCKPFLEPGLSKLQRQILLWLFESYNAVSGCPDSFGALPAGYKNHTLAMAGWDETMEGPAIRWRWQHRRVISDKERLSGVNGLPDRPQALSRALLRLEQRGLVKRLWNVPTAVGAISIPAGDGRYTNYVLLTPRGMAVANNLVVTWRAETPLPEEL